MKATGLHLGWSTAPLGNPPSMVLGTCAAISVRPALHSWWADAHEGANEILAQHSSRLTVVQTLYTLIQICKGELHETVFILPDLHHCGGT